ncbi:hypothetical protein ACFSC6_01040 [Rufibacter sediminis]|uniref:AMP-activated protein kinase glycogen-binding domain-containing protein n=1 Tax=Rufibacter sediminis TaxID=2762756 RepID=A0ABR6VMD4_9BACT|nr:hypothetical protein [Rufibacter sediminis]MBC3538065.1 hypothetical protein [Rufibacter sediminis]
MEINIVWSSWQRLFLACWCTVILVVALQLACHAQTPVKRYTVKDGKMMIELSKKIRAAELDTFLVQFNLTDVGFKQFFQSNSSDSLQQQGWQIDQSLADKVVFSKPLQVFEHIKSPVERIVLTEKGKGGTVNFGMINRGVVFGYNRFRNRMAFPEQDSVVTFYLRNNGQARKVYLAGTFNKWVPDALPMAKTDSGWIALVPLQPGKHWYKFLVDGSWTTDPDNLLKENDGRGNTNSVFFKTNAIFRLSAYQNARRVYLAGSFNNWAERDLVMNKTGKGWELPLYLAEGTHIYKYIVDGEWHHEPGKTETVPDGYQGLNSMLRIGKPYLFRLEGYPDAKEVFLAGSFNTWRDFELVMKKTPTGWELPYTIGPGNYEYKFKVDGRWVLDPSNPVKVGNRDGNGSSYLILGPNHTFRLKNHAKAKDVFLAGDFNNWDPNALRMKREGNDWVFSVHLPVGKNRYKFYVDGNWIIDPGNKLWEQNEYGTGNSIIWVE